MGSSTTQQQTQTKDPWGPAQPHLKGIMEEGRRLYDSGAGSQLWNRPVLHGLDDSTVQGLDITKQIARQSAGAAGLPFNAATAGVANNGITGAMGQPLGVLGGVASGANKINTGGLYGGLLGQSLTQNQQPNDVMLGIAQQGALGGDNPHLKDILAANAARTANRVNSSMSGAGRYGSYSHGDTLARSISEATNPILASAWESDQNRRLSDAGLRLNAAGTLAGGNRADLAGALGAASGLTGVQAQNIQNQTGAAGGLLDTYARGQQQAQGWAAMAPMLNELQYDPAKRLMGAGTFMDARNQTNLDAERQLFERTQNMPWDLLNKYQGSVSGLGGLLQGMGTTTGSGTQQQNPGIMGTMGDIAKLAAAFLPMLSDRDEKTDIKKIGESRETGLPIYSYRYKSDPKTYPKVVGPMAQDIERAYPGSTIRINGKLAVKPEAVGLLGAR